MSLSMVKCNNILCKHFKTLKLFFELQQNNQNSHSLNRFSYSLNIKIRQNINVNYVYSIFCFL